MRGEEEEKLHLLIEGHTFAAVEMALRSLSEMLPRGGVPFSGPRPEKILLEESGEGETFHLILPGYRCSGCGVEFWTVEDGRAHFAGRWH